MKRPKILRQQCESWSSTGDNSKFDIHTDVIKSTAFPDTFELPKTAFFWEQIEFSTWFSVMGFADMEATSNAWY